MLLRLRVDVRIALPPKRHLRQDLYPGALSEADVALDVVKEFVERVHRDAVGATVIRSVNSGSRPFAFAVTRTQSLRRGPYSRTWKVAFLKDGAEWRADLELLRPDSLHPIGRVSGAHRRVHVPAV
jgi:hypothetical protein